MKATVYNNIRCSKCRDAISILEDHEVEVQVVNYPVDRLTENDLRNILSLLNLKPKDIVRRGEKLFKELNLNQFLTDDDYLVETMVNNPILIERPIVVVGGRAVVGRPPENVLSLIS